MDGSEKDQTRELTRTLNALLGVRKKQEDKHFDEVLLENGEVSPRIVLNFLMAAWVFFAHMFSNVSVMSSQHVYKRCVVPPLEDNFTELQIVEITNQTLYPCSYPDVNFTKLLLETNYSYEKIVSRVSSLSNVKRIRCNKQKLQWYYILHDLDNEGIIPAEQLYSLETYYNTYCLSQEKKIVFSAVSNIGIIIFALPLGVISDLYGRKLSYLLAYLINVLAVATLFIPNVWICGIGKSCLETALTPCMLFLVLFIEKCSVKSRRYFGLSLFIFRSLAIFTVRYSLDLMHIYLLRLTNMLVVLSTIPFAYWYIQESPRWLYYNGMQKQAWLQFVDEHNLPPSSSGIKDRIERPSLIEHFSFYKQMVYKFRIVKVVCLVFASCSCFPLQRTNLYTPPEATKYLIGHFQLASLLTLTTMAVNYVAIMYVPYRFVFMIHYTIVTILNGTFLIHMHIAGYFDACIKGLGLSAQYLVLYQALEHFPTTQRGTVVGICLAVSGISNMVPLCLYGLYGNPKRGMYFNLYTFTFSVMCVILTSFTHNTRNANLPDVTKEGLGIEFVNFC